MRNTRCLSLQPHAHRFNLRRIPKLYRPAGPGYRCQAMIGKLLLFGRGLGYGQFMYKTHEHTQSLSSFIPSNKRAGPRLHTKHTQSHLRHREQSSPSAPHPSCSPVSSRCEAGCTPTPHPGSFPAGGSVRREHRKSDRCHMCEHSLSVLFFQGKHTQSIALFRINIRFYNIHIKIHHVMFAHQSQYNYTQERCLLQCWLSVFLFPFSSSQPAATTNCFHY